MNIGDAAARAHLPPKTLRYYEEIELVVPSGRRPNGYRDYAERDVHKLGFVQRARSLGFSVEQCRDLLALYNDQDRASADVKAVALGHVVEIDRKIKELSAMRETLTHLIDQCHGDSRPDCPILDKLAAEVNA